MICCLGLQPLYVSSYYSAHYREIQAVNVCTALSYDQPLFI